MLGESAMNPTCLVSLKGPISFEFVFEHPFSCHHIGPRRSRKVPHVIGQQSKELSLHSSSPIWIGEGSTVSQGNWRQGRSLEKCWLTKTVLPTGDHGMLVRHGRHRYSTSREGQAGTMARTMSLGQHHGRHGGQRHGCLDRRRGRTLGVDSAKASRRLQSGYQLLPRRASARTTGGLGCRPGTKAARSWCGAGKQAWPQRWPTHRAWARSREPRWLQPDRQVRKGWVLQGAGGRTWLCRGSCSCRQ